MARVFGLGTTEVKKSDLGVVVTGWAALQRKLESIGPEAMLLGKRALYEELVLIRTVSMKNTPVDTGALRASHEMPIVMIESGGVEGRLVVGGPTAGYAPAVHEEDPPKFHEVGGPKFLERAIMSAKLGMAERISKRIDSYGGLG